MSSEQIRTLAREFFMEQDRRKGALSPTLCTPEYTATIANNPPMDLAGHSAFGMMFYQGFPDVYHTLDDVIVEGDRAAVRFTLRGTHTGAFMGVPPTGRRIEVTAIAIQHFVDGKIARLWGQFDQVGLMQQLGVMPVPSEVN
jgi:predicted ester cyclase